MSVPATPSPAPAAASDDSGRTGANAQAVDPGSTPVSADQTPAPAERGPDYFREAFSRIRGYRQEAGPRAPQAPPARSADGRETEQPGRSQQPPSARRPSRSESRANPPATTLPPQGTPIQGTEPVLALTESQLARRVQAEADRVMAKRQADEQVRAQQEEERRLREDDPYGYVQLVKEREQQTEAEQRRRREATSLLEQQLHHYDRGILDPVVGALPESVRQKILKGVRADGISGRTEVARASLTALRSLWTAEGRETAKSALMKDPAFVKEVLARYAGQVERTEPESVHALPPSSRASAQSSDESVNAWMRQASRGIRGL